MILSFAYSMNNLAVLMPREGGGFYIPIQARWGIDCLHFALYHRYFTAFPTASQVG